MGKNPVKKIAFAAMAGVAPPSVTKACRPGGALEAAFDGKRVDASHPAAVAYIAKQNRATLPPPAHGIDPLYNDAVESCQARGRWSARGVSEALGIDQRRAGGILKQMRAAGVVPERVKATAPPPAPVTVATQPTPRWALREQREQRQRRPATEPDHVDPETEGVPDDIQAYADMPLREIIERFGTATRFKDWLDATQKIEMIAEKRRKNAEGDGELVSRELVQRGVIEPINAAHIKLLSDGAKTIARRSVAITAAGGAVEDVEAFVIEQISSFIRPMKSKVARALRNA